MTCLLNLLGLQLTLFVILSTKSQPLMTVFTSIELRKIAPIGIHILCWIGFLFTRLLREGTIDFRAETFLETAAFALTTISLFYIMAYWVTPLLSEKKIALFVLTAMGLIAVYTVSRSGLLIFFGLKDFKTASLSPHLVINFWNGFIFSIAACGLGFAQKYYREELNRQRLQRELLLTELAFLKSQMNPHFLYNSLNFIYSQAISVSEPLSKSILLLSEIMRYAIEEADKNGKVPLEKEIKHLDNFIEIHRLRFGGKLQIIYEKHPPQYPAQIVPFMLISIVENAFKHGLVTKKETPLIIELTFQNNNLIFFVKNKIDTQAHKHLTNGVGLTNIKRMLDLAYSGKHTLDIKNDSVFFEIHLKLEL
jgi:hypothetical protein